MTDRLDEAIVQQAALAEAIRKDGNQRLAEWATTIKEQLERHRERYRDEHPADYMPRLNGF